MSESIKADLKRRASETEASAEPPTAFNSADPPRNFALPMEERIRALTIGAPAYALRKRHIEDIEAKMTETLIALHDSLVMKGGRSREQIRAAIVEKAKTFDLEKLNVLIKNHNRYYPIEANLSFAREGYLVSGKLWKPEEPWTVERLVAHVENRLSSERAL